MANKTTKPTTNKNEVALRKKYGKHGEILQMPEYDLIIKYSSKARRKRLLKFVPTNGKDYVEVSAEDLIPIIIENFNIQHMDAMSVDVTQIDMIEVERTLKGVCDRDFKKGEPMEFNYRHMMPLEFAIAEQAIKLANISDLKVYKITKREIEKALGAISEHTRKFTEQVYAKTLKKDDK